MKRVYSMVLSSLVGLLVSHTITFAGPQPPTGSWRIVCIGDSITQGSSSYRSYRYEFWKRLIDEGVPFDLVGSQQNNFGGNPSFPNYQGQAFDRAHDGHWAWDTEDVLEGYVCNENLCPGVPGGKLSEWLGGYTPDMALIHLGHNDLFRRWPASRSSNNLSTIINQLRADNPDVVIFLSNLINNRNSEGTINGAIQLLAASKNTAQSPVILVNNFTGFGSGDLQSDQIHPNASGELKMATQFGDAVMEYLNFNASPVIEAGPNQTVTWPQTTITLSGTATDDGEPQPPGVLSTEWVCLAGPELPLIDQPNQLVTTVTMSAGGVYFFRLRVSDGEFTLDDFLLVTIEDGGNCEGEPVLLATEEGWSLFPASSYNGYTGGSGAGAGFSWGTVTDYHGISGDVALQSLPFDGGNFGNALVGARLDFPISFTTSGVWYVWVRMYAADGHDSVHVGLDESEVSFAGNGVSPPGSSSGWVWQGHLANQTTRLTVNVPTRGMHRLNFWIEESGTAFEQVLVTRDPNLVPDGSIPTAVSLSNFCDADGDTLPDDWETLHFGSTVPLPGGDSDGDFSTNLDEYIAGTGAMNPLDYVRILTDPDGNGGMDLVIPSVPGRLYDVEFTEDIMAEPVVWQPLQSNLTGATGLFRISHPAAPAQAVYRLDVRMEE